MQYIKVPATDSTNTDLKRRLHDNPASQNTCLRAETQTQGRGQHGANWQAEPNKNLTFSILLKDINLRPSHAFKINAIVSLGIVKLLHSKVRQKTFRVKWPNDILSGHRKICGVLIENSLRGNLIKHSIIGIGLNVNQTNFENFPKASSLKNITGTSFPLETLMKNIAKEIEGSLYSQRHTPMAKILEAYESHLYRLNVPTLFEFPRGKRQTGIIQGVSLDGQLKVKFGGEIQNFNLKEIKMLY